MRDWAAQGMTVETCLRELATLMQSQNSGKQTYAVLVWVEGARIRIYRARDEVFQLEGDTLLAKKLTRYLKPITNRAHASKPDWHEAVGLDSLFACKEGRKSETGVIMGLVFPMGEGERLWLITRFADGIFLPTQGLRRRQGLGKWLARHLMDVRNRERVLRLERSRAQEAAVGALAHELKTPLAAVRQALEAMRKPGSDEALFSSCRQSLTRCERLIRNYLEFLKLEELSLSPTPLLPLLQEAWEGLRFRREASGAACKFHIPEDAQATLIWAHPVFTHQVFTNLFENACRAIEVDKHRGKVRAGHGDGFIRVEIQAHGSYTRVNFFDSGPGVPVFLRDRLFQPFVSGFKQGHGLGLALCRKIMEAHAGEIQYICPLGGETCFSLLFRTVTDGKNP